MKFCLIFFFISVFNVLRYSSRKKLKENKKVLWRGQTNDQLGNVFEPTSKSDLARFNQLEAKVNNENSFVSANSKLRTFGTDASIPIKKEVTYRKPIYIDENTNGFKSNEMESNFLETSTQPEIPKESQLKKDISFNSNQIDDSTTYRKAFVVGEKKVEKINQKNEVNENVEVISTNENNQNKLSIFNTKENNKNNIKKIKTPERNTVKQTETQPFFVNEEEINNLSYKLAELFRNIILEVVNPNNQPYNINKILEQNNSTIQETFKDSFNKLRNSNNYFNYPNNTENYTNYNDTEYNYPNSTEYSLNYNDTEYNNHNNTENYKNYNDTEYNYPNSTEYSLNYNETFNPNEYNYPNSTEYSLNYNETYNPNENIIPNNTENYTNYNLTNDPNESNYPNNTEYSINYNYSETYNTYEYKYPNNTENYTNYKDTTEYNYPNNTEYSLNNIYNENQTNPSQFTNPPFNEKEFNILFNNNDTLRQSNKRQSNKVKNVPKNLVKNKTLVNNHSKPKNSTVTQIKIQSKFENSTTNLITEKTNLNQSVTIHYKPLNKTNSININNPITKNPKDKNSTVNKNSSINQNVSNLSQNNTSLGKMLNFKSVNNKKTEIQNKIVSNISVQKALHHVNKKIKQNHKSQQVHNQNKKEPQMNSENLRKNITPQPKNTSEAEKLGIEFDDSSVISELLKNLSH